MNSQEIRLLVEQMQEYQEKRESATYSWLKYLIGLAAGALAVLASFSGVPRHGLQRYAMTTAAITLATGVLAGLIRIYGELQTARFFATETAKQSQELLSGVRTDFSPIVIEKTGFWQICELICYFALFISLVSLVCLLLLSPVGDSAH